MKIFALAALAVTLTGAINLRDGDLEGLATEDWVDGEWQDPCDEFLPDCDLHDPCADVADDDAAWKECHDGPAGDDFEADIAACTADMSEEDWGALLQCYEDHPITMESDNAHADDAQE